MYPKDQGGNAETLFHGNTSSEAARLVYAESTKLFADAIRANVEAGSYTIADMGSHRCEFLMDLVSSLPEYQFKTIAIDENADDLEVCGADEKIVGNISELELGDKTVDITIARYAIAWNTLAEQKDILREVKRITRGISVIQHQGARPESPEDLQTASRELFGGVVPKLRRDAFFFSSAEQIEGFMRELGITFERIQHREIAGLSDMLIEKYALSEEDAGEVKKILAESDYVMQSAWVLKF